MGDTVNIRHARLELDHGFPGAVASRPSAATVSGNANVVLAQGGDQAVATVAKANRPGQIINGVVAVARSRAVEIRHSVPAHPDLLQVTGHIQRGGDGVRAFLLFDLGLFRRGGHLRFPDLKTGAGQQRYLGQLENLAGIASAGAQRFILDRRSLAGPGGVEQQAPQVRRHGELAALAASPHPVQLLAEKLASGKISGTDEADQAAAGKPLRFVDRPQRRPPAISIGILPGDLWPGGDGHGRQARGGNFFR